MKTMVIVPLLFLCIFAQAHKNNLVDRIYPSIDNVDTINVNCMIIQKNKPRKQIMELLSVVDGTQDTILIVADKSEYKTFKLGETYSLSLAMVRQFTYTIVRNGYILQAVFDRDTKYATCIPYINKVKPTLYILLMNNGIITLKEQHPNSIRDCSESRRLKFVDSFSTIEPEAGAVWELELPNKYGYTYDAAGRKLKAECLLSDVRIIDWDDAVVAGNDAAAPASLQTGGMGLPVVGPGGDAGPMPPGSEVMVEPVTLMTLEYSAGHVYRNGRLERVGNPYGYWADSAFHYHITDYQGNIRAVIAEDGALEEINSYYPYGGLMGAAGTGVQPHKYGAKELDRENGLDLYDSHARWYDPLLARTTTQDPLAEKYRHLSPYLWCAGNPINLVDPNGRYIVGVDDCAVSYDEKTKTWSSNASKDIIEICEAMMTTNMGTTQLDKMINKSDFPIYLKIELETSKENHNQFGSTKNYYTITSEGKKHTGALIKIFKRTIELKGKDDDNFRNYDFSLKARVGFVAVHESEHALNPEAAKENVGEEKAEAVARQAELAAIEEYVNKRNKK